MTARKYRCRLIKAWVIAVNELHAICFLHKQPGTVVKLEACWERRGMYHNHIAHSELLSRSNQDQRLWVVDRHRLGQNDPMPLQA